MSDRGRDARNVLAVATCLAGVMALSTSVAAQDEEFGWADTAEFSAVFSGGNAGTSTIGLGNQLVHRWDGATLTLDAAALRAESTRYVRTAVGESVESFSLQRVGTTELTAENYFVRGRYDQDLSPTTFWYVGTGWERNTFSGIDHRYTVVGGVGNTWFDTDASTFKTAYGMSYTVQDDVVDGGAQTFGGFRLTYEYRRVLTSTTEFTSELIADENLEDQDDFRTDLANAVSVAMTSQLALKVAWRVLYDNAPSLVRAPLVRPDGSATGAAVTVPLREVDQRLTFALVATF